MQIDKTDLLIAKMQKWLFKIFVVFLIIAFLFVGITFVNIMPVDSDDDTKIAFVIDKGMGKSKIIDSLKDKDLIRSSLFAKIYIGVFERTTIYPGTYELSKNMGLTDIIEILSSGKSLENEEVQITFVEGKSFPYYVQKISEEFSIKEENIYSVINDEKYLNKLINDYWFITDDILNKDIYYPLEGYIFPDTYSFRKKSSVEDIFKVFLDEMDNILSENKDEITKSGYSIHSLLTLASVVELEAVSAEDRASVAGLFYNRLKDSIALGSDVTTYYAVKKDLSLRLEQVDIDSCNAYNTRGVCARKGLPIGPICAISESSIKAVLNPTKTDNYFFVADKNGKLYFAKDYEGHRAIIKKLEEQGLWAE